LIPMHTRSLKASEINKKWWVIDAQDLVLGRLASLVAVYLKGKHKASYTPNLDCGDNIIVINAEKVHVTGKKLEDKLFHYHTGYPGGIKTLTMKERLTGQHPERVIMKAVQRMLAKGPLQRKILGNLKVYAGSAHPHEAQAPQILDVSKMNPKNSRRD